MNDKRLTTSAGAPVADDNNSISAGARGPLTFDNVQLFEKLAHFNRERIPERVVHARGAGAYGTFTLSKSLSCYRRVYSHTRTHNGTGWASTTTSYL